MKFKIRYADQIVGFLSLGAVLALVFALVILGSKQRWFARDYNFLTYFETSSGLSVGMPLQYKGFTIGKIKSISLMADDTVEVRFFVYDTYYERAKEGSVIELIVNPIGLGNQFLLHPGNGKSIAKEGSIIPRLDSAEGIARVNAGFVTIPKRDDTIANLMAQINPLLTNLNTTLSQVNGAFDGLGTGPLANSMTSLERILSDVNVITGNLETLSAGLSDANGLIPRLIDSDGKIFDSIEASLSSVEGTLSNLEHLSTLLKGQTPDIARLIQDLHIAVVKGQDVLEGLKNNPLLKGGIPERVQTDSTGTTTRAIEF